MADYLGVIIWKLNASWARHYLSSGEIFSLPVPKPGRQGLFSDLAIYYLIVKFGL